MTSSGHPSDTAGIVGAVALSSLRTLGDTRLQRFAKELLPTPPAPWPADLPWQLGCRLGIPHSEWRHRWGEALGAAAACLAGAQSLGIAALGWQDDGYPALLREIADPPLMLWYRGDTAALAAPCIAVVGSRDALPASVQVARRLGRDLAASGITVVSGLARGVDAAAHQGALETGRTVGVLGCGVDVDYPREHRPLATRIAATGAVLSELEPGRQPRPGHFPLRNRLISGLSRAVVVVEASDRSGSLITARMALEQGRDVLAVPGSVASGRHRGCHALIKDGARLVETVDDVLQEIGWGTPAMPAQGEGGNLLQLSELEQVMAAGESYTVDELAACTGRQAPGLLADLGALELAGKITRVAGGGFLRLD